MNETVHVEQVVIWTRADSGGGVYGGCNPPQMILRSPAHLGLKYESRPVFLTGP